MIRIYSKIPETAKNKYTRQNAPLSQGADAKPSQLFNTVNKNRALPRKNKLIPTLRKKLGTTFICPSLLSSCLSLFSLFPKEDGFNGATDWLRFNFHFLFLLFGNYPQNSVLCANFGGNPFISAKNGSYAQYLLKSRGLCG